VDLNMLYQENFCNTLQPKN